MLFLTKILHCYSLLIIITNFSASKIRTTLLAIFLHQTYITINERNKGQTNFLYQPDQ